MPDRDDPDDPAIEVTRVVRERPEPNEYFNNVIPWRAVNPFNVYDPYATADGRGVHRDVLDRVDEVTAQMFGSKNYLKYIAHNEEDDRLPDTPNSYLEALWPTLEANVGHEIRRLIRGEALQRPLVRVDRVPREHLQPGEGALLNQWGLYFAEWPPSPDMRSRPSLLNGRILGVYLGAVLDDPNDLKVWEETYVHFPHYAVEMGTNSSLRKAKNRDKFKSTMSAEGAANFAAFANTALKLVPKEDGGQKLAIDLGRVNAQFLDFRIRMPDRFGRTRWQMISVLVAFENAFDIEVNPYGMIIIDYTDTYLPLFNEESQPDAGGSSEERRGK
ncbi:hypothetical protein [Kibdelosporangium philippinense]|uniref:hypothetical protein n=1 Tax=Kibdelosporangium philippinense TaxID=211113 RepID=UPI00361DA22E